MKRHLIQSLALLLALIPSGSRAAVVYSGVQNIAIPQTFDGVYLNIQSGATAFTEPATWNTAPWLNPFFGGVGIANGSLLQPFVTGANQVVNIAPGGIIGIGGNFGPAPGGSSTHVGPASNQFQPVVTGYVGYRFQLPGAGADYFGWLGVQVNNVGAGTIIDWAYQNVAGQPVAAGSVSAVPEPGTAMFGLALYGVCVRRRRRGA